jgi:hypothetical protein
VEGGTRSIRRRPAQMSISNTTVADGRNYEVVGKYGNRCLKNIQIFLKIILFLRFVTMVYQYNCCNSGHYPSSCHLFKTRRIV